MDGDYDNKSIEIIPRPLVPYYATNRSSSTLPECYEHWDLPEVCNHSNLPEVYIPVLMDNQRAVVSYVPNIPSSLPKSEDGSIRPCGTAVPPRKPFWGRHWIWIAVLGLLVVAGIIGGIVSGVLLSRRREVDSEPSRDLAGQDPSTSSTTTTSPGLQSTQVPTTKPAPTASTTSSTTTTGSSTPSTTSTKPSPSKPPTSLPSTIILGSASRPGSPESSNFSIAFLPGQECFFTVTGKANENPCGKSWELNGRNYTIHNCGAPLALTIDTPPARFFGNCPAAGSTPVNCRNAGGAGGRRSPGRGLQETNFNEGGEKKGGSRSGSLGKGNGISFRR
ncbi:hypothetical protein QBC38DRAFT_524246 [Podospora fimiseda]|uniref:Uncharacterized protein n=1 Tax=Podospora fimiseda TaxID=252190 RepID=A0AAN6YKH0_9PEZI|nr:hypothetical protein QBC38DRAFT_524246 [Podospora fimiseda]